MSLDPAVVMGTLTAQLATMRRFSVVDLALNEIHPLFNDGSHSIMLHKLKQARKPHEPIPSDVYEDARQRSLLSRESDLQMGPAETKSFTEAQFLADQFDFITPFAGFELAWGSVFLGLISDRRTRFKKTIRPTGGVRIFLYGDGATSSWTSKCDFGAERAGLLVVAGDVDSGIQEQDKYRSLLVSNCVMKLARLLDEEEGGRLTLMNAFITDEKTLELFVFFFLGEPQRQQIQVLQNSFDLRCANDIQAALIFMGNFLDNHYSTCTHEFICRLTEKIKTCPCPKGAISRTAFLRRGRGDDDESGREHKEDDSGGEHDPDDGTGAPGGGRALDDPRERGGETEIDWSLIEGLLMPALKKTKSVVYLRKHNIRCGVAKIVGKRELDILLYLNLSGQPGFPVVESSFPYYGDRSCVLMKWMGQSIVSPHIISTYHSRNLATGVLQAVLALHVRRIAHLDIKPHNIVVDNKGFCALVDFGHSERFDSSSSAYVDGPRGTQLWQGPEVERGERYHAFQADLWSVGAVLGYLAASDGDVPLLRVGEKMMVDCPEDRLPLSSALSIIQSWHGLGNLERNKVECSVSGKPRVQNYIVDTNNCVRPLL